MGSKEVLNSVNNSKLIVLSQSVDKKMLEKIESDAKKEKSPPGKLSRNFSCTG